MKKWLKRFVGIVVALILVLTVAVPQTDVQAAKAKQPKVLVVYFTGTGTTKSAAKKIQKATSGTLYQIKAAKPYTKADLNYNNANCRANREQQNSKCRPKIKGKVKNIRKYDVIFIGYPIWWGKEPMIIRTFLESYNLKGKKIVPFCTSGGSGISGSIKDIKKSAKGAKILSGRDLTDESYQTIKKWAKKKL